jgi:predicted transcriptional regulator
VKPNLKARKQLYMTVLLINLITFPIVVILGSIFSPSIFLSSINNIIIVYLFIESFPMIIETLFFLRAFNFLLEREFFIDPISKRTILISTLSANILSFIFGFLILPVFFYFPLIPSFFLFGVISLLSFLFMSFLVILFLFLITFLVFNKNENQLNKTHLIDFKNKLGLGHVLLVITAISIIIFFFVMVIEYTMILEYRKNGFWLSYGDVDLNWFIIFFVLIIIVFLVSFLIVLSYSEFWEYISYRNHVNKGHHTLSIDDLFENENRKNIIKIILEEPGIHNNELLRRCNLQKGQLQWHLQVLVQYSIIRKEKIGQYSTYFPSMNNKDQIKNKNYRFISKSKTSLRILNMIEDNPGINPSKIASNLNLNKSSVKYHVDRLNEGNMIISEQDGRIIKLRVKKE